MKNVVVGGGVIGASIAWHMAERGLGEVVLLERDRLGSGTTWHSAGNITWKPSPEHDAPVLYAFETIARLERELGLATGWLETGRTFLAASNEVREDLANFDRLANERGIAARWSPPRGKRAQSAAQPRGGQWHLVEPALRPAQPCRPHRGLCGGGPAQRAEVREGVEVLGVTTAGGRVAGIDTSAGFICS